MIERHVRNRWRSVWCFFEGNVTVVTDEDEYVTELKGVRFSPNLGCNLFSPNAEFDGETWDHLGGTNRVMIAFDGRVTFSGKDDMLMAKAYRLGDDFNVALPSLVPSAPPCIPRIDINLLHCIYGNVDEYLLKHTAHHLGVAHEWKMHECTGCSMAKGFRKGIPHQTNSRSQVKLGKTFCWPRRS